MERLVREIGSDQVAAFFLVLARVGPLFLVGPLFSSRLLPARAKGICAVGLAVGLLPAAGSAARVPLDVLGFAGLLLKEALVGLAFAYTLAALFAAVAVAGAFLDTLVGFSFGALVDPITGTQAPVLNQLYSFLGVMVFIAIGGDEWVIRGLAETYETVPLDRAPALGPLSTGVLAAFTSVFAAALEVAAPVVIALTITDAAFGMVARVVPQLNVFAVGVPAKIVVGLLIVGVSLPFVGGWIADELQTSVGAALRSLRVA